MVQALQTRLEGLPDGQEKWLLDLVALGTVCDVVTLVDENRANVYWGLKVMARAHRPGLKALMAVSGVEPSQVNARSLGFGLGPRMNAAGRLETAQYALDMLRALDSDTALEKAQLLDDMNKARRAEQDKIFKEAIVEAEQRAAVEAPAKAAKARMIVDAEAEAEKRRIEAEGEASAIFAKLDAEARGLYEILAKKAEGLKQLVESCGGAHEAFKLLMLEHLDHLTDASAKAISNIKFDKIVVWENGGEKGSSTANILQNMSRTLPPMMQVMRDVAGIELPETLLKMKSDEEPTATNGEATPAGGARA